MLDKYEFSGLATILFFLALIIGAFLYWDYAKDTKMASLGYQKTAIAGSSMAQWQKVKEVSHD